MQVRQRRVAGAEVVQVQADGHGVQPLDHARAGVEVVHERALGDLQRQARGVEARRAEHALDLGGDAALRELAAGDVDADAERRPARVLALPFARPAGRLRPASSRRSARSSPVSSATGMKRSGGSSPRLGVPPARERLEPQHRAARRDPRWAGSRGRSRGAASARRRSVSSRSDDTARWCMSPANTWWRARPPALARYIAVSASRSMSSGRVVARARQRDADADAGEHLVPAHLDRRRQLLVDPLGDAGGVRLAVDVVEQHGELVAAQARERVARPHAALEPARGADQQLVAGLVSEAVVDRLEAIEIEVEHREQRIAQRAPRAVKQVLEAVEEQRAVREIGERIVERLPLKLLLDLLALGDVARDPEGADDVPRRDRAAGASSSRPSGRRRRPGSPSPRRSPAAVRCG